MPNGQQTEDVDVTTPTGDVVTVKGIPKGLPDDALRTHLSQKYPDVFPPKKPEAPPLSPEPEPEGHWWSGAASTIRDWASEAATKGADILDEHRQHLSTIADTLNRSLKDIPKVFTEPVKPEEKVPLFSPPGAMPMQDGLVAADTVALRRAGRLAQDLMGIPAAPLNAALDVSGLQPSVDAGVTAISNMTKSMSPGAKVAKEHEGKSWHEVLFTPGGITTGIPDADAMHDSIAPIIMFGGTERAGAAAIPEAAFRPYVPTRGELRVPTRFFPREGEAERMPVQLPPLEGQPIEPATAEELEAARTAVLPEAPGAPRTAEQVLRAAEERRMRAAVVPGRPTPPEQRLMELGPQARMLPRRALEQMGAVEPLPEAPPETAQPKTSTAGVNRALLTGQMVNPDLLTVEPDVHTWIDPNDVKKAEERAKAGEPLTAIVSPQGVVLDGHGSYFAAKELGLPIRVTVDENVLPGEESGKIGASHLIAGPDKEVRAAAAVDTPIPGAGKPGEQPEMIPGADVSREEVKARSDMPSIPPEVRQPRGMVFSDAELDDVLRRHREFGGSSTLIDSVTGVASDAGQMKKFFVGGVVEPMITQGDPTIGQLHDFADANAGVLATGQNALGTWTETDTAGKKTGRVFTELASMYDNQEEANRAAVMRGEREIYHPDKGSFPAVYPKPPIAVGGISERAGKIVGTKPVEPEDMVQAIRDESAALKERIRTAPPGPERDAAQQRYVENQEILDILERQPVKAEAAPEAAQTPQQIATIGGAKYRFESMGLHHFDDPRTGTTLALKPEDFTPEGVRAALEKSREEFRKGDIARAARGEPPLMRPEAGTLYALPIPQFAKAFGRAYQDLIVNPAARTLRGWLDKVNQMDGIGHAIRYLQAAPFPREFQRGIRGAEAEMNWARVQAKRLGKRMSDPSLSQQEQQLLMGIIRGDLTEAQVRAATKNPKIGDAIEAAKTARQFLDSYGGQAVMQGLLKDSTYFHNYGRYVPRMYRDYEVNYEEMLQRLGEKKPTRMEMDRFKKRADIDPMTRLLMGEIEEPAYPVAKGIAQLARDVAYNKFFDKIAANPEYTKDAFTQGYTQLPESYRLGALSRKFVRNDLYHEIEAVTKPPNEWRQAVDAIYAPYKFGKVILNPASFVWHTVSRAFMNHLGGLPITRADIYARAALETFRQGPWWERAIKSGAIDGDRLNTADLEHMLDSWNKTGSGSIPVRFMAWWRDTEEAFRIGKYGTAARTFTDPMRVETFRRIAKMYGKFEEMMKVAKFIHNIENGMDDQAAGLDARKWTVDYTHTSRFVKDARMAVPFFTFYAKALPLVLESAVTAPWRLAGVGATAYALESYFREKAGYTKEDDRKMREISRVQGEKGQGLDQYLGLDVPGLQRYMIFPFKTPDGRVQYLDLNHMLHWTGIGAPPGPHVAGMGVLDPKTYLYQNPFLSTALPAITRVDPFTGRQLYGTPWDVLSERGIRTIRPGFMSAAARVWKSYQGQPDVSGHPESLTSVAAQELSGIKLRPFSRPTEIKARIGEMHKELEAVRSELYQKMRDPSLSAEEKNAQRQKLSQEMRDIVTRYRKSAFGQRAILPQEPLPEAPSTFAPYFPEAR